MTWNHPHTLARRAAVTRLIVAAVFGVVLAAFFRVQILGKDQYLIQSENNRLRPVVIPAPRGLIVDRQGVVMAENIPAYTISLLGADQASMRETLNRMGEYAGFDDEYVDGLLSRRTRSVGDQLVVLRDAPFAVVSALEERRTTFPGLVIQTEPKRRYPQGPLAAHVVGYVNEITESELEAGSVEGARFGALVGRAGIERQYDQRLRGIDGRRLLEVDARGRLVREIGVLPGSEARPGETLHLSLDLELQKYVRDQFPEGSRGAVVAMDPRTGDVLGMYSAPSFDPNLFVGGIDPSSWQAIRDAADNPLFNRAVQGRYPPASPWKLAVAAMALRRGIVTMRTKMPQPCRGGLQYYTRYFRCWLAEGHGDLTLAEAIQYSCDTYFYQLGLQLELPNLLSDGAGLGFNERTGIDLPNESRPVFPATTAYFDERFGPRGWTRAVTLNLAIGQGENSQTLLNMVRFYAMLATPDGRAPRPRLVTGNPSDFTAVPSLGLDEAQILQLRQALVTVVSSGTAAASRIANLRIAGKTGTAQNSHGPDHGWFVAFAPADDPEIVVGAIVEAGRHGSTVAPMVTRIIARYLLGEDEVLDEPFDLDVPLDSAPGPIPIRSDTTGVIGP